MALQLPLTEFRIHALDRVDQRPAQADRFSRRDVDFRTTPGEADQIAIGAHV